jgi:hypothetical protein
MVKKFPNEGCTNSIDNYLINYFKETNRVNNFQSSNVSTEFNGIAWNENSWWFLKSLINSKKPFYSIHTINELINKQNIIEIW